MGACPFSGIVSVEEIRGGSTKMAQNFACFYFSKIDDCGMCNSDVQCG